MLIYYLLSILLLKLFIGLLFKLFID